MALLPIVTVPDPLLRETSAPVERVDDDVRRLLDDMLETMYDAPGIGLAAIQVGVPRRIVVVDCAGRDAEEADAAETQGDSQTDGAAASDDIPRKPLFLINPEIVSYGTGKRVYEEGCLSLPDVLVDVERPSTAVLKYIDRDGEAQEQEIDGLLATVVQHEVDHLDGKLIIDFLSRLKRDMVVRKLRKQARV
ncbi:MAG: peptide deformylase [Pseudomonadota bacterium]